MSNNQPRLVDLVQMLIDAKIPVHSYSSEHGIWLDRGFNGQSARIIRPTLLSVVREINIQQSITYIDGDELI